MLPHSPTSSSDFGVDTLVEHAERTTFPWLMSNVVDNETGRPLAEGKVTHVLEWWGRKIGLVRVSARNLIRRSSQEVHCALFNLKLCS